jgi:hypothetical protein
MLNGSSQVLRIPTYEQESVSENENHFSSSTGVLPGLFEVYVRTGVAGYWSIILHLLDYAV